MHLSNIFKMKIVHAVLAIFCLIYSVSCDLQENPQPEPKTTIPPIPINTTSTAPTPTTPSLNTTSVAPNTTTSSTTSTSTTVAPNSTTTTSTTVLPTTTTVPTTPSPVTPNATTEAPTTVGPVTTQAPPKVAKWVVANDTTHVVCIIADMAIQLSLSYNDTSSNSTKDFVINVPADNTTSVTGLCGNNTQLLQVEWADKKTGNFSNTILLSFEKNDTLNEYTISYINVTLQPSEIEMKMNDSITLVNVNKEFATPVHKSYHCSKEQAISLENKLVTATMKISHVQWEAFHTTNETNFSAVQDCESSSSPDIVPIAVGCALVGLVVVVLIAYLVGRRRSQARGYLSIDAQE